MSVAASTPMSTAASAAAVAGDTDRPDGVAGSSATRVRSSPVMVMG